MKGNICPICFNGLLPWWLSSEESSAKAGNMGSVLGMGRSPGGGHGKPLQYSSLGDAMDRGVWQATQFIESQRVGHNLATKQQQLALIDL